MSPKRIVTWVDACNVCGKKVSGPTKPAVLKAKATCEAKPGPGKLRFRNGTKLTRRANSRVVFSGSAVAYEILKTRVEGNKSAHWHSYFVKATTQGGQTSTFWMSEKSFLERVPETAFEVEVQNGI